MRPGETWPHSQANPHRFIYATLMCLLIRAIYIIDIFAWVKLYTPLAIINKGKGREAKLSLLVERAVTVLLYMLKTYPHAVPM